MFDPWACNAWRGEDRHVVGVMVNCLQNADRLLNGDDVTSNS